MSIITRVKRRVDAAGSAANLIVGGCSDDGRRKAMYAGHLVACKNILIQCFEPQKMRRCSTEPMDAGG